MKYLPLLLPLGLAGFVAFWCLIVKMIALMGWQRLVPDYQTALPPEPPRVGLGQAAIGSVRYRQALTAGVSAAGLSLAARFPFGLGHPPLLIPWAALAPLRSEKFLWATTYSTSIQTSRGPVALQFTSAALAEAARPWLRPA